MEAYVGNRSLNESHQHIVEEVGEFLRRIPEAMDKRVLIIGMTNMITHLDPAVQRQGRFDHKIKVELPVEEEVRDLINHLISERSHFEDLDIEPLVKALTGRPLSDAAFVIREASRLAARADKDALDNQSLAEALLALPDPGNAKTIGFTAKHPAKP